MPRRIVPLVNNEVYHILNRGVEKRIIFTRGRDYQRFLRTLYYYQFQGPKPSFSKYSKDSINPFKPLYENKIVEIWAYCLMPNHFHLLVRQFKENGISKFLSQLTNSYTKYFNTKYTRVGPLLQGSFKAVLVENDEQLLHLSRYIHINPLVSGLEKSLFGYPYSSLSEYQTRPELCVTQKILEQFKSPRDYLKFLSDHVDYASTLEILKHQTLEDI